MNQPKIELDENHRYTVDGKPMDGLTSTIAEAGLIRNGGDPWYLKKGSFIHKATELWDLGILEETTVDPVEVAGPLESWKRFRKDQNYTPTQIEWMTYHPFLMVATTVDRLPLLDIKSGAPEAWHILQIGFQAACLRERGMSISDFAGKPMDVYLDPDGGPPKVRVYTQAEMREAFKVYSSMLYFIRWRRDKK